MTRQRLPGAPSLDGSRTSASARLPAGPCRLDQMGEAGFEPAKAEPLRLQRNPVDRLGTPPAPVSILDPVYRIRGHPAGSLYFELGVFGSAHGCTDVLRFHSMG